MRIETDIKLDFKDVLIRPKRSALSSRKTVDIKRQYEFRWSKKHFSGVPIIAANMDGVGTMAMAETFAEDDNGLTVALHKHYAPEAQIAFLEENGPSSVWYSIGIADADVQKLRVVMDSDLQRKGRGIEKLCIDVANGYSEQFVDFVKRTREMVPDLTIMAGNVVTGEMVEELILAGADVVKVGIGPGSVCTTRKMTGVGYPQLSAIIECADAAHGLGGLVCSDGGCVVPGDLVKAFGAGADFVMLGGMLAGHDQGGGQITEIDNKQFMQFYGMSSATAMEIHSGGVAEYRASEGKSVLISYRGDVTGTIREILGGIRSACTYIGARRLKELSKRTTFVRVSEQLNAVFGED